MRTPDINRSLEKSISRDRLAKYRSNQDDDLDAALSLYEKNMRLSEAFYPPLQCLEICLRNGIHASMRSKYGSGWLRDPTVPLENTARKMIDVTLSGIKKPEAEITSGDIVAELRFAFWVGILGPRYDATLWRAAIHKCFPNARSLRRKQVHHRMNALRRFRNRIAHHEPIFFRPVGQLHNEIIEAIGWMCADTRAWAEYHSRVPCVLNPN